MKIPITSLSAIKRAVIVICPNPFNFHNEVYVRYLILIDDAGHAVWLDDPTQDEVMSIIRHLKGEENGVAYSPCPFCQSKETIQ